MDLTPATDKDIMDELGKRFQQFVFFGTQPDADDKNLFRYQLKGTSAIEALGLTDILKYSVIRQQLGVDEAGPYRVKPVE